MVTFLMLLLSTIFFAEILVRFLARPLQCPQSFDYILLLGANGRIKSPVTQDRAANAANALKKWPSAKLIVTGNEDKGEVTVYRALLQEHGISNFLPEFKSRNTWDNMVLSLPLLEKDKNILIVTSEYHQPRALAMARSLGLKASAFGKDISSYKNRRYFFAKERLSNVRYLPHLLWNLLCNTIRGK